MHRSLLDQYVIITNINIIFMPSGVKCQRAKNRS